MNSIINIGNVQPTPPPGYAVPLQTSGIVTQIASTESDTVELSSLGQALSQAAELSSLSVARIRAFRAAIADGTFETPERINGTADRLLKHVL